MRRIVRLVVVLSVLAGLAAPASFAAERMWVGFHDDPSFRWVPNRAERVRGSAELNASIIRLLVQWNLVAKTRPTTATDPFDPAYEFSDIDEAVLAAQQNDQEVILTISGTPRWANGGKTPNVMPKRVADFTSFARAIASRYSGRFVGYPFVRFWSVWNEPNLQLFLAPQFDSKGRSVAPANYAKLAAAAYSGIKAGNPRALVAIGETSARGSDKPNGLRPTHTPGTLRRARREGEPAPQVRRLVAPPVPVQPELASEPGREVAERLARVAAAARRQPQDVVPSQVRADLGHGVRPPDPAPGLARGLVRDAGGVHPAVDLHGRPVPVRADVHLVRLPGRPGAALGVGRVHAERHAEEPVPRRASRRARDRSTRETASSPSAGARSRRS